MESIEEKKAWEEVKQKSRFHHAFRGWRIFLSTTRNLPIHVSAAFLVLALGLYFRVSSAELILLIFAIGLVLISEAFNSAIEIDIDLTSPQYHPYARDTKDVAAGAVLLAVLTAVIVGLVIFLPKIINVI